MASVKIVLWKHKTHKDGTHPVRLEVIQNRKRTVKTLFSIKTGDWTGERVKPSHPHATHYNRLIANELAQFTDRVFELDRTGKAYSNEDIFYPINKTTLLVDCILDYAKRKAINNARKYENLADKIKLFRPRVMMDQVTEPFMDDFKKWLKDQKRINSMETVNRYIKFLKTVLYEQYKLHNFDNRAVLAYKAPMGSGNKIKLTREEFEGILTAKINPELELARDCFCLQVFMRGIRISDMLQLKQSDIVDDRAIFIEQKTQKQQDIRIREEAAKIIDRWRDKSLWYVLPIMMLEPSDPRKDRHYQKHIEVKTSQVNRDLKLVAAIAGIKKKVTTHVARHTFANWADKANLTGREIQKLLNHSSLTVTEAYLSQLRKSSELDDAADKVFGWET